MKQGSNIGRDETFWGNVCKLIHIRLLRKRYLLSRTLGVLFLYDFVCVVGACFLLRDTRCLEVVGGQSIFIWIGLLEIILPWNFFTDQRISMYPGNTRTRFVSKIMADQMAVLLYLLCVALLYLVQCGLLWLFLHGRGVSVACSLSYLGAGILSVYGLCLLVSGISAWILAMNARFGRKFDLCFDVMLLLMLCYSGMHDPDMLIREVQWGGLKWMFENTDIVNYFGGCVIVWLICILTAGILAWHIPSLKKPGGMGYVVTMGTVAVVIFAQIAAVSSIDFGEEKREQREESMQDTICSTFLAELEGTDSYGEDIIIDVVDAQNGMSYGGLEDYLGMDIVYRWIDVESAVEGRVASAEELSAVDEGHALVVWMVPEIRVGGWEVGRELAENMKGDIRQPGDTQKLKLEYFGERVQRVCCDFFPSADRFIYRGRRDVLMKDYRNREMELGCFVVVKERPCEK